MLTYIDANTSMRPTDKMHGQFSSKKKEAFQRQQLQDRFFFPLYKRFSEAVWVWSNCVSVRNLIFKGCLSVESRILLHVVSSALPLPLPFALIPSSPCTPLPRVFVCVLVYLCERPRYGHETLAVILPPATLCVLSWKTCATDPLTKMFCHTPLWLSFKSGH